MDRAVSRHLASARAGVARVPPAFYRRDMSDAERSASPAGDDAAAREPEKPARREDALPEIAFEDFARIELRTGRVLAAEPHPAADRLLVLKVDVGDSEPRTIVAGIRADWPSDELVGKTLVVCCNLKPAVLRGVESRGMMLAVRGEERVWPLTIAGAAAPGTRVT